MVPYAERLGELRSQRDNYDPLAHRGLRELERARNEDEAFADERSTIEAYRAKRLRELKAMQKAAPLDLLVKNMISE